MKINITLDMTPEELRKSLGLPDLNALNESLVKKISKYFEEGKLDPEHLMKIMNPMSNPFTNFFMKTAQANMNMMHKKDKKTP